MIDCCQQSADCGLRECVIGLIEEVFGTIVQSDFRHYCKIGTYFKQAGKCEIKDIQTGNLGRIYRIDFYSIFVGEIFSA